MSSGFLTEKEAAAAREKRQDEWERVRKDTDPREAPVDQIMAPAESRPLYDVLNDNRMKEQEAIMAQRAFKNQIRGLNEDESAYLSQLSQAEYKRERVLQREADALIGELKRNQTSMGIRASLEKKPDSKPRPTSALLDTKKVKKQSTLLKGAIKRKTSTDDEEPKKKIEKEDSKEDLAKQNEALAKVNDLLKKETRVVEGSSLSLLANQYSDSEGGNSDTSNSDEDSDGLEIRNAS